MGGLAVEEGGHLFIDVPAVLRRGQAEVHIGALRLPQTLVVGCDDLRLLHGAVPDVVQTLAQLCHFLGSVGIDDDELYVLGEGVVCLELGQCRLKGGVVIDI